MSRLSLDVGLPALLGAEIVAAPASLGIAAAAGVAPWWALLGGLVAGLAICALRIGDAVVWRWWVRAARRVWRRSPRTLLGERALGDASQSVPLPDGSTRIVGSRALAAAVSKVLQGADIQRCYRHAGIMLPPPGTAVAAPVLAGELAFGDVGQFGDRQLVALGNGQVYIDGDVVDITEIDTSTPDFLGWYHPTIPGVPVNVEDPDNNLVGVLRDGNTLVTMISVWGLEHMPTVLHPRRAETPNVLPLSVIAAHMSRVGLSVDVDVIVEGERTSGDPYAPHYDRYLGERAAAGRRTTTLVVRMDTDNPDHIEGLVWRGSSAQAAVAATRRIAIAMQRAGCRVKILEAEHMLDTALAAVGGERALTDTFETGWGDLRQRGRGYLTSFYFNADDVRADKLDEVWTYTAEPTRPLTHTTLVVALRHGDNAIMASAMLRVVSDRPLTRMPASHLNRATGWQWEALQHTMIGAQRLHGLPSAPVTPALDNAVVVGSSGVMLGGVGHDELLLMPLSDPAQPTRIVLRTNDDLAVRQLIRRAAATCERVAVYDISGSWAMTGASPYIWNTANPSATPPWTPTLVVHNGQVNPYPGAWASVTVCEPAAVSNSVADIELDVDLGADQILLRTRRFNLPLIPVTIHNEQTYLQ
ncbi:type VII secretion protein EccE [Mycobacterium attenuatum]|uniref:type VII secretion protein EccE n=1 Tax=Mycobacterium attenuatum TaxID=2341086 RepID=UPI000F1662EB|nr:type VII secretion protein EccE [Mycobacterium attenuatum]VBA62440.1 ESX-5 secretion system protein EccE5 [Mycobacterium attenuatum]